MALKPGIKIPDTINKEGLHFTEFTVTRRSGTIKMQQTVEATEPEFDIKKNYNHKDLYTIDDFFDKLDN